MLEEIIKNDVIKAEQIFSQSDNKIELIKNICEKGYRKEFLELLPKFCLGNKKTIKNIFFNRTFDNFKVKKIKTNTTYTSNTVNNFLKKNIKKSPKTLEESIIQTNNDWDVKFTRKLFTKIDINRSA